MPAFISNGATLIIVVLLVLVIAYRYYSAFIAAKVLALDPARQTPAHTFNDGQNYHPTNKWVLFGHHFAAISGAGPLIGPVLAAQFGYLPGLLWILIGVCLAGAVQDFVVLVLSIRRNGKSLAQIAFSDIGRGAGTAATIGILFVLVIALAGLGKVVTKALGGETVTYDGGTEFIAGNKPIHVSEPSGSVSSYQVPAGTTIRYPNGVERPVANPFTLKVESQTGQAIDIQNNAIAPGTRLKVSAGAAARETPARVAYEAGTLFLTTADNPIKPGGMTGETYTYEIPKGARIVALDGKETVAAEPFVLTVRSAPIAGAASGTRPRLAVPFGLTATRAGANPATFVPETRFVVPQGGAPIVANGLANNVYTYTIPAGTEIHDPQTARMVKADAAFTLVVRPADIMVREMPGLALLVPKGEGAPKAKQDFPGSPWGTFTIALTIPIAFMTGIYLYRLRKNRVLESSIIGGLLTVGAVYLGGMMNDPQSMLYGYRDMFDLREKEIGIAIAVYGFAASVLPVWMLLCPRDYLSSFLKIGTILLVILAVIVAHPVIRTPAINTPFLGGGPTTGAGGGLFPFLFIFIMCGAISGFHALVASGTTPKMINSERDARAIGYGAMLMEGLVGIVALIAATCLPVSAYYDINTPSRAIPTWQKQIEEVRASDSAKKLDDELPDVGEHIQGRTGGAVTLAMGMAYIVNTAVHNVIGQGDKAPPWLASFFKYMYHFFIMFEALFILTTIDTGTRVGRFLLQESLGKWVHPRLGKLDWWPSAILATAVISFGWWYFLHSNAFDAIWKMFGIANQMLAVVALAIATAALAQSDKRRYCWVTVIPMLAVAITTTSASIIMITQLATQYGKAADAGVKFNCVVSVACIVAIVACAAIVVATAMMKAVRSKPPADLGQPMAGVGA
jgi:carbon starvation protein